MLGSKIECPILGGKIILPMIDYFPPDSFLPPSRRGMHALDRREDHTLLRARRLRDPTTVPRLANGSTPLRNPLRVGTVRELRN